MSQVIIAAVCTDDQDAVLSLLDQGVSPNYVDIETGLSVLEVASRFGRGEIAAMLIQHGANPVVTKDGGIGIKLF